MSAKRMLFKIALTVGIFITLISLAIPSVVYADDPIPTPNNGNCVICHEDLYFLHDTGNWFCLKESPMSCVNCHGGDPNTLDKELAHTQRAAHPIINDDVTTCQQCHPNECYDRVEIFDQTAGISKVLVAAPYIPSYSTDYIPVTATQQKPNKMLVYWEIVPIILVSGLAITFYLIARKRHN